jgi:hypothetical protein
MNVATDDMDDSADMPASQPLHDALEHCQEQILPKYQSADRLALDFQRRHRRRAGTVAWLGAVAVILAELQLLVPTVKFGEAPPWAGFPPDIWQLIIRAVPILQGSLAIIEIAEVGLLVWLVLRGMKDSLKEEWLLERYKAERLRLLKFSFLLQPELWRGQAQEIQRCKDSLGDRVRDITAATRASLECWISQGTVPAVHSPPPSGPSMGVLHELEDHYRSKRLHFQMDYISGAIKRYLERDQKTRLAAPGLFFGSVAFVVVHAAVELAHGENLSKFFIFLAAALPALGAGYRTVRAAHESARNASRDESNHYILSKLSDRLRSAPDPATAFREMGFCEQILEANHREWMRLMMEAEWFG